MNYFEMYKISLQIIRDKKPNNFQEFINISQSHDFIVEARKKFNDDTAVIADLKEIIENQIQDNVIRGKIEKTKTCDSIEINGLTTTGYEYLLNLENDTFVNKLKATLKEEGIPLTPINISKFIAKLAF